MAFDTTRNVNSFARKHKIKTDLGYMYWPRAGYTFFKRVPNVFSYVNHFLFALTITSLGRGTVGLNNSPERILEMVLY